VEYRIVRTRQNRETSDFAVFFYFRHTVFFGQRLLLERGSSYFEEWLVNLSPIFSSIHTMWK
jgi:hypothetical protein